MSNRNIDRFLVLFLTMLTLVLQKTSYSYFILFIGILVWICFYLINNKKKNFEIILVRMLTLCVPLSFTNIFGGLYSQSVISWYNIFLIFLTTVVIIKNLTEHSFYLDMLSFMSLQIVILGLFPIFVSRYRISAVKQYLNLIAPFILVIIGNNIKYICDDNDKKIILYDYIFATNIAAIGTFVQFVVKSFLNIELGNYAFLGGYRHSYGFLFADYSFLSLYLVTGATILLYLVYNKEINMKLGLIDIIFLLVVSVITSARTGIFAFIVVVVLFTIPKIIYYLIYNFPRIILISSAVIILVGASFLLVGNVRGSRKLSDSGRGKLNQQAFKIFLDKPIFGVGFGSQNYSEISGMLPHNLIFQFLAQGGLIFSIPLFITLYMILFSSKRNDPILFGTILCILIGSLFIPNIFNSRYMGVIFLIFSMRSNIKGYSNNNIKEIEYEI